MERAALSGAGFGLSIARVRLLTRVPRAAALALALVVAPAAAAASDLLTLSFGSVGGVRDQVTGFDQRLRGAEVGAVCDVPVGWALAVHNPPGHGLVKDGAAYLSGSVDLMADAFGAHRAPMRLALIAPDRGAGPVRVDGDARLFVAGAGAVRRRLPPQAISVRAGLGCRPAAPRRALQRPRPHRQLRRRAQKARAWRRPERRRRPWWMF